MRVRLKDTYARGEATPLEPGKWYEAERGPGDPRIYEVSISGKQVQVPAELLDERSAPDNAWENLGFGALQPREPGQPAVMARTRLECREGHRIQFPPETIMPRQTPPGSSLRDSRYPLWPRGQRVFLLAQDGRWARRRSRFLGFCVGQPRSRGRLS